MHGSNSTSKDYQLGFCGVEFCMIYNKQRLGEKDVTGGKGIESCLSEENDIDYDYLSKTIESTTTTFSMDSFDSSENMSVESLLNTQKTDIDNVIIDDFKDGSRSASASAKASAVMQSTTQKEDADFDCLIKRIVSTSTTFSMDFSDSSVNASVESLSIIENMDADTDSIST